MNPSKEGIGNRVRQLRKARGVSQEALSNATSTSVSMISMVERGLRVPSIGTLAVFATALGCTGAWGGLAEFFSEEAPPP